MINLKIKTKGVKHCLTFKNVCFIDHHYDETGIGITIHYVQYPFVGRPHFSFWPLALDDITMVMPTTRPRTLLDKTVISELRAVLGLAKIKIKEQFRHYDLSRRK